MLLTTLAATAFTAVAESHNLHVVILLLRLTEFVRHRHNIARYTLWEPARGAPFRFRACLIGVWLCSVRAFDALGVVRVLKEDK